MDGKIIINTKNVTETVSKKGKPLFRFTLVFGFLPADGNEDNALLIQQNGCLLGWEINPKDFNDKRVAWMPPSTRMGVRNFQTTTVSPKFYETVMTALTNQGAVQAYHQKSAEWLQEQETLFLTTAIQKVEKEKRKAESVPGVESIGGLVIE